MQIVIDGLITEYMKSGGGPVVLFVHGWGDSLKTFDALCEAFDHDYTCVRLDLPGFGGSEVPEGAWSLSDYADFVQHFLQKLKIPTIDVLVGHSNGGAIALKSIESGQVNAHKLILLSASGIRPKKTIKTTMVTMGAKIGKHVTKVLPRANRRALRKALYRKLGSDYLTSPQMAETFKKVVREDIRGGLAGVGLPVLLIYGQADTDTPLWIARSFKKLLPDARLHIVPHAGHFVHQDALAETIHTMKAFIT